MWQLKGTPTVEKVTQKLAKEWMELEAVGIDRPLSERRLGVYRKMLADRMFRPVTWAKVWCKETNQWYRVNGKHTSTLFSSMPSLSEFDLKVIVETYTADYLSDVSNLYSTFDSKTQTRNATDINRSFAATIPELTKYDSAMINLFVGSLSYADNPAAAGASSNNTAAERAEKLFDWVEFCVWVGDVIFEGHRGASKAHLCRVPVVAAMRGCWMKTKRAAEEFWTAVRDDSGASPDLPDRKLAKWLMITTARQGRTSTPLRHRIMPREFYVKSIHAWNAWRSSEKTNLQYYADAKIPNFK